MNHKQTDQKTQTRIQCHLDKTAIAECGIIFMDKSREGSESSAKAYCKEQTPMFAKHAVTIEKSIQKPDKEAAYYIGQKCSP